MMLLLIERYPIGKTRVTAVSLCEHTKYVHLSTKWPGTYERVTGSFIPLEVESEKTTAAFSFLFPPSQEL